MDIEQLEDDAVDEELKDDVCQNGYFSNRWLAYYDNRAPLFGCTVFIVGTENPRQQELADKLVALGADVTSWSDMCTHVVAAVLDESHTPDKMNKFFVVKP
jgi:BRCA1 C Terminus (BRCT) domain